MIKSIDTWLPQSSHILCRWHVNMNVLAKTKKFFPGPIKGEDGITRRHPKFKEFIADWISLLNSSTISEYTKNLDHFRRHPRGAVDYVEGAWLHLWKEKLVRYWVDQNLHFGVVVTSPIEGCHSTLKSYLQRGSGDLNFVYDRLITFWDEQKRGIEAALSTQQLRPRHNTNTPLFATLISQVYDYAL